MTWLPFDLHPEYPPEGIPREQLHARYGEAFRERLQKSFEVSGLVYNPPPDVVPNTMRALALTELARDRGVHGQVHDRLMQAYWEEARNIGDPEELRLLADEAGLDEAEVVEATEGSTYRERVRSSTAEALGMGISAVPAFVLDRRLLVLGAQPQAIFQQAVGRLRNGQREGL